MPSIVIANLTQSASPVIVARQCTSFWSKFKGLMLQPAIPEYEGLLFDEGRDSRMSAAIHMFFMRMPIAVIWIDNRLIVADKTHALPWRPYYAPCCAARYVLETHPNRMIDFNKGDQLSFHYE